jgi:hypothetical protein
MVMSRVGLPYSLFFGRPLSLRLNDLATQANFLLLPVIEITRLIGAPFRRPMRPTENLETSRIRLYHNIGIIVEPKHPIDDYVLMCCECGYAVS